MDTMSGPGHESIIRAALDNEAIRAFFSSWEVYQTIIAHDYMQHSLLVELVEAELARLPGGRRRVLELGCGDAYVLRQAAGRRPVSHYTGIDLSDMALEMGHKGMAEAPGVLAHELICGDMLAHLRALEGPYDLVLAGYSLHHLQTPKKVEALAEIRRLLTPGGAFLIYDLIQDPAEERVAYLHRVCDGFAAQWPALNAAQHADIREHVVSRDFPETREALRRLAGDAHLALRLEQGLDPNGFFSVLVFDAA